MYNAFLLVQLSTKKRYSMNVRYYYGCYLTLSNALSLGMPSTLVTCDGTMTVAC